MSVIENGTFARLIVMNHYAALQVIFVLAALHAELDRRKKEI